MDEEIEQLVVSVRANTRGFADDVSAMRASIEGGLGEGAVRAGRLIEDALLRAVRSGKFGFDDLKRLALATLAEITRALIASQSSGGVAGGGGGIGGLLSGLIPALIGGFPGRAVGGLVSPSRPYWVGEHGPELFVPGSSGRIEPATGGNGLSGGGRDVRVTIYVNSSAEAAPAMLKRSSRQVARAVRAALAQG